MFKKVTFLVLALCAFNAQADSSAATNTRFQHIEGLKTYSLGRFTVGGDIKPSLGHFLGFFDLEKDVSVFAGISPVFLEPHVKAEMRLSQGVDLEGDALGYGLGLYVSSKAIVIAGITYLIYKAYKNYKKKNVSISDTDLTLETQSN